MEPDSTTSENLNKSSKHVPVFPFNVNARNMELYSEIVNRNIGNGGSTERQLIQSLQSLGLIHNKLQCSKGDPKCCMIVQPARVIDRVKWVCENCKVSMSIRTGSFFLRISCSILQVLQIILAWCEDADCEDVANFFELKQKTVTSVYDKLDTIAIEEQKKMRLGGEGTVVLAEMYPDCLNRLSPDTTDQPHTHSVLMMADTKHIPTRYSFHVIKTDLKKSQAMGNKMLCKEVQDALSSTTLPNSTVVVGNYVPMVEGAQPLQKLLQYCDTDMQHFLCERIWRQALTLCVATRSLSDGAGGGGAVARYLHTAAYRVRHGHGFYRHVLQLVAADRRHIGGLVDPNTM